LSSSLMAIRRIIYAGFISIRRFLYLLYVQAYLDPLIRDPFWANAQHFIYTAQKKLPFSDQHDTKCK